MWCFTLGAVLIRLIYAAITWVLIKSLTMAFTAEPPGVAVPIRCCLGDDDYGAVGVVGDVGADRVHEQPLEPAGATGADDDHVRVRSRGQEFLGGHAGDGTHGDRRRPAVLVGLLHHVVHCVWSSPGMATWLAAEPPGPPQWNLARPRPAR
jgi:hypothetical protein